MKSYEGKKLKGLNEGKTPSQLALTYLKSRYIGLWPALFMGTLFGFIMSFIGAYTGMWHGKLFMVGEEFNGVKDIFAALNTTALQWFGLDSTAFCLTPAGPSSGIPPCGTSRPSLWVATSCTICCARMRI